MSTFFRLHTDGTRKPVALENTYAAPGDSPCWLVGGGPSLSAMPCDRIAASPWPVMTLNLAGTGLLRPDLWTAYDPSTRFLPDVYLDARTSKLPPARRAMEFVPETTFKVCDCPNTVFFDRDRERGYADFLDRRHTRIVDWNDTFVQAIDLLHRLGFRTVFVAGCEFRVRPSREQLDCGKAAGVEYDPAASLNAFVEACRTAGVSREELASLAAPRQYHFDEAKPLAAAIQTEEHYLRVLQTLRLSRRAMTIAGLRLISVTPDSRLNDWFPYEPIETVLSMVDGNTETCVRGLYTSRASRMPVLSGPVIDLEPPRAGRRTSLPERDGDLLVEAEGAVGMMM